MIVYYAVVNVENGERDGERDDDWGKALKMIASDARPARFHIHLLTRDPWESSYPYKRSNRHLRNTATLFYIFPAFSDIFGNVHRLCLLIIECSQMFLTGALKG